MATYINGINDYVPQAQPFQPDLNFYAGVLSTKQGQYDQGLNQLSSIYSSVFNSPMLGEDNIARRDNYFKTIEQQVQKIAGLDLSIDQNVTTAKSLFDPILNDKDIVKDMVFTKGAYSALGKGEQYRNCIDPEKCGGEYWDEGLQAVKYSMEEFQKASPEQRMNMSAPEFVPFQNVTKQAFKAAKDAGFNISYDHKSADGRYIVTDTNGQLLLGPDGKGILPQYLYGIFGNNASIQKMYSTQAYVQRKNTLKQIAAQRGISEDEAESEYLNNIMLQAVPKIEKSKNDLNQIREAADVDKKALEILAKTNPTDDVQEAFNEAQKILQDTQPSVDYHEQVSNLITTAPNLNNLNALRNRVDNVVANANFMNTINSAAYDYAMGTAKQDVKNDSYALAAYNNSLDLSKAKQLKAYDQQIWKEQQVLLGNLNTDQYGNIDSNKILQSNDQRQAIEALVKNNVSKDELLKLGITKLDKKALEKLAESGLLNKENTTLVKNFANISKEAEPFQNTYNENNKVVSAAMDQALGNSKVFVKNMLSSMINSFKNANTLQGKDAIGIKAKILVDTKNILQGTGIDYNALIRGEIPLNNLDDKVSVSMANSALKIRTSSVASRVYTDGYDDVTLAQLQAANQTAEGLYKQRNLDLKNAVATNLAREITSANNGDISPEEYQKKQALYTSFLNPNGGMVSPTDAKNMYIRQTSGKYFDKTYYDGRLGTERVVTAKKQASDDFDNQYVQALKAINDNLTNFNSKTNSRDKGGMEAVKKSAEKIFDGKQPLDPNTRYVQNMILDFANNPNENPIIITGAGVDGNMIGSQVNSSSEEKQDLFSKIADKIKTGNAKDLNLITTTQFIPKTFDQSAFSFNSSVDKAIYTDPNNPDAFPGDFTKEAVMVKMTIGEKEYRDLYGIKASDPVTESDRSLVVKTIPNDKGFPSSLTPFLQGIQKSPQDIYLEDRNNNLSFDLGNKGKSSIQRLSDDSLKINFIAPIFNDETGQLEENKWEYVIPNQNLNGAYSNMINILNETNQISNSKMKQYTQYARSK